MKDVVVGVIDSDSEDASDQHCDDDSQTDESQSSSDDEQAALQVDCQVTRSGRTVRRWTDNANADFFL